MTRRVLSFLAWGDFHARSRFDRSTTPEEKWGTTRKLLYPTYKSNNQTRGGLGRVCATGMYRSIGLMEFPKF